MASELSKLIDDELEKAERGSQANDNRQQLRSSLRIKTNAQKTSQASPTLSWRQLSWWTWRRSASAALVALLLFGVTYLMFGSSASGRSSTGTSEETDSPMKNPTDMFSKGSGAETATHSRHHDSQTPAVEDEGQSDPLSEGPPPGAAEASQNAPTSVMPPAASIAAAETPAPGYSALPAEAPVPESSSPALGKAPATPVFLAPLGRRLIL